MQFTYSTGCSSLVGQADMRWQYPARGTKNDTHMYRVFHKLVPHFFFYKVGSKLNKQVSPRTKISFIAGWAIVLTPKEGLERVTTNLGILNGNIKKVTEIGVLWANFTNFRPAQDPQIHRKMDYSQMTPFWTSKMEWQERGFHLSHQDVPPKVSNGSMQQKCRFCYRNWNWKNMRS